jgi:hypothetical protein
MRKCAVLKKIYRRGEVVQVKAMSQRRRQSDQARLAFVCVCLFVLGGRALAGEAVNLLNAQDASDGWEQLFDGKSLKGWQATGDADWEAVDGEIRVTRGNPGWLMTKRNFKDFDLRVEFKAPSATNSGIFLRTPLTPIDPAKDCYELNIAPRDNPYPTASLVGRWKISTTPEGYSVRLPTGESRFRRSGGPAHSIDAWDGQWHAFDVSLDGAAVLISLDGALLTTYIAPAAGSNPQGGRIGLQYREGPVSFRGIRIKPKEKGRESTKVPEKAR